MQSHYLSFRKSTIHYRYSGEGPETVICLHGFGTYAATFDWLAAHVSGHRFIAFDLPLHGQTRWEDGQTFYPDQMLDIIGLCPHAQHHRFALMGYSMGGRMALQLLQMVPEKITRIILLAPDGLHHNPFYWLATQTSGGNRLFRHVMHHPERFIKLLHSTEKLGWVNKGVRKFVDLYMEDKHVRALIYEAWTMFRKFKPQLPQLIKQINHHQIPVAMIYGNYDNVIPLQPGIRFYQKIQSPKKMDIIPTGHQVLHLKNAPYIAEAFNVFA